MAKETQIGQLVIDLQIKTQALEKGLETARKKIQQLEDQNNQLQNSNKQVDASFIAMSATAVASLIKIGSAIKDCIDEYKSHEQAMSSLKDVSDHTGQSMEGYSEIMEKYSSIMNKTDIATTIKNFSLMRFYNRTN